MHWSPLTQLTANQDESSRAICLSQLLALTACAKALSEPEDQVLDLDGLAEATDEAAKAKAVNADPRVEQLRMHLLDGIRAVSLAYASDAEVTQALSDLLKACTNTNIATPLSLSAVTLFEHVSLLIQREMDAVWLSLAGLLLFRQAKDSNLSESSTHQIQSGMRGILHRGLEYFSTSRGEAHRLVGPCSVLTHLQPWRPIRTLFKASWNGPRWLSHPSLAYCARCRSIWRI